MPTGTNWSGERATLLGKRISELGLRLQGTDVERLTERLYEELKARGLGFMPHCFTELKLWPISPLVMGGDPRKPLRQLLEADLVYVRDLVRPDELAGEQWKHLAMLAHHCYGSVDLALRAIMAAAKMGALHPSAPDQYLKMLQSTARPDTNQ